MAIRISVDGHEVLIHEKEVTGRQIKEVARQQGVDINMDLTLLRCFGDEILIIPDDVAVRMRRHSGSFLTRSPEEIPDYNRILEEHLRA